MMDAHDAATVRNLEQIQEHGAPGGIGRGATLALVVLSGACIALGGIALGGRRHATMSERRADPLGELAAHTTASSVMPGEVTFPSLLSDRASPATAFAASPGNAAAVALSPPPPGDRLSVIPLPARHALMAGTSLGRSKDMLTALADDATDATKPSSSGGGGSGSITLSGGTSGATEMASPGTEGGWQLQVSSYKTQAEADAFVTQLRARGHKAHVQVAEIPKRGTWYRVKIGPFATMNEASRYRSTFEAKEKMPGFVVKSGTDPR